jgi:hypothetical protein
MQRSSVFSVQERFYPAFHSILSSATVTTSQLNCVKGSPRVTGKEFLIKQER